MELKQQMRHNRDLSPKLQSILRQLREGLGQLYGDRLHQVILYGSQARGEATAVSDIDVLILLHGQVNPYTEIERAGSLTATLSLQHDVVLSCLYLSADQLHLQEPLLQANIQRDGIYLCLLKNSGARLFAFKES